LSLFRTTTALAMTDLGNKRTPLRSFSPF